MQVTCPDCGRSIVAGRRYRLEPLAEFMDCSLNQVGKALGLSGGARKPAMCHGVTRQIAEKAAGMLKAHPSEIWPEVVDHDIEDSLSVCAADGCEERFLPRNRVHLYCSKRCKVRMKQRRYRTTETGKAINRRVTAAWKVECADYWNAYLRDYHQRTSDQKREYMRLYRSRNRDRVNAYRREWRAKKKGQAA